MTDDVKPRTDRELVTARELGAPPERVFAAFSDPEQLSRWWGPDGFTNTFHVFDFRPGGAWRFTMRGPDGTEYLNESVFTEIEPPSRLVLRHDSRPHFVAEFDFEPRPSGSLIVYRQVFDSSEECRRIAKFAGDANEQNMDRLERVLAEGAG